MTNKTTNEMNKLAIDKVLLEALNAVRVNSIKSKVDAKRAIVTAMKKRNINRGLIEIVSEDGVNFNAIFEVISASTSRSILDTNLIDEVRVRDGFSSRKAKRYSFDTISLCIKDNSKCFFSIFGKDIFLMKSNAGWIEPLYETSEGKFISLDTEKEYSSIADAIKQSHYKVKDVFHYKPFAWTASDKINNTMQYCLVNGEKGDNRFEILNNATSGGFKIFMDKYIAKMQASNFNEKELAELTIEIQKNFGYIGNCLTGSVSWGIVKDFMVYNGKFPNYTQEMHLDSKVLAFEKEEISLEELNAHLKETCGEEFIDNSAEDIIKELYNFLSNKSNHACGTADGNAIGNARAIASSFFAETGVMIPEKFFAGLAVQARPANCKVELTIVDFNTFKAFCHGAKTLAKNEGTTISFKNKNQNWEETNWDEVAFLVDRNAMKLEHEYDRAIDLHVLAITKESQGKTSKQLMSTLLGVEKSLEVKGEETVYQLVAQLARIHTNDVVTSRILEAKYKMPTPSEMINAINSGFTTNVLNGAAPNAKFQDRALLNYIVRQSVNTFSNDIDGINFKLTSHNRRLVPDMANIITGAKIRGILKMGEVFINRINVSSVCMLKYPKMGIYEYYTAKNISLKAVKARCKRLVADGTINEFEARAIENFYGNLDIALAILPAYMTIAHCCAGLDFDFDGACFIEKTKEKFIKDEAGNKVSSLTEMEIITNKIMDKILRVTPITINF